jgi:hypothetical protein
MEKISYLPSDVGTLEEPWIVTFGAQLEELKEGEGFRDYMLG